MLNAKILKLHLGDKKELKDESKTKEIAMKKCRKAMSLAASSVMKCIYIAKLAHQSCGCLKVASTQSKMCYISRGQHKY